MNRLRTLEATALVATVLAFGLTALLVPASAATEANGVAATLLATIGWAGAGVLAVGLEGAFFVGYERLDRAGYPRAALGGGAVIALLGVGDLAWNLRVLVELGLPETVNAGRYGLAVAIVATAAAAVYLRTELRVLADMLVYAFGEVTSGLSKPDLSAARATLMAAVLVLAAVSGVVTLGPLPAADRSTAAGTLVDDFEDGDFSGWQGSGGSITSSDPIEGTYSLELTDGDNRYESVSSDLSEVSTLIDIDSGSGFICFELRNSASNDRIYRIEAKADGTLVYEKPLNTGNTWRSFDTSKPVRVVVTNIDHSANTLDLRAYQDGTEIASANGIGHLNDVVGDEVIFSSFSTTGEFDYVGINGVSKPGVTVDGTVRNSDGGSISDASIELRQNGSVVQSTAANNSGGYSFTGVSDGDYSVRASASGYQNKSKTITVAGSPLTADLTLNEEGTFTREFQLGPDAKQTYPPSLSRLELYRFDRAIEFPLPGGTTFEAGPGTWKQVETADFNSQGAAYARLEDGQPYRVDVVATSGPRQTRWESLGWRANASRPDPYGITVGNGDEQTPTGTATATPTGGDAPTVEYPDLTPPTDPFDLDDDGQYFDEPDGSGGNVTAPSGGSGFGPRLAGECLMADGTGGVLVEYWDPDYQTTSLEYNLSAGNNSYAGARTFDTPAGYATWCVADTLTNNASDGTTDLTGNLTQNGTTTNFSDTLDQSAVFGGPIGGGGGGGEPSTGQQVVGIGLSAGAAYLLVRRFTEFRLTEALSGVASRLPIGGGGS